MKIWLKVGDYVWSTYHGIGVVTSIDPKNDSTEIDFGDYKQTCNSQGAEFDYQENTWDKLATISRIDDILERLPKDKYRVEKLIELKKGEIVLFRDGISEVCKVGVFVGLSGNRDRPYSVYYDGCISSWAQCVRYEGNESLILSICED